jgi:hypothetical protein
MENLVSIDVATADVKRWMDHKRIAEKRRAELVSAQEIMVNAIMDGSLILEDDMKWKHTLIFPIEGEVGVSEIKYKSRLTDMDIEPYRKIVKGSDFDSQMKQVKLALTNKPVGVINALDSSTDKQISDAIALFFV